MLLHRDAWHGATVPRLFGLTCMTCMTLRWRLRPMCCTEMPDMVSLVRLGSRVHDTAFVLRLSRVLYRDA